MMIMTILTKKCDVQNGPNLGVCGVRGVWRQGGGSVKRVDAHLNGVTGYGNRMAQAGNNPGMTFRRATADKLPLAKPGEWVADQAVSILWMPGGRHVIDCAVDGKPTRLTIDVKEEVVAGLNDELAEMVKSSHAGKSAAPRADYGHNRSGPNSGKPLIFYWEEGRGIMLKIGWTRAATEAIRGGEWSYWSPQFRFSGDPDGVVELEGLSGISVGGLVNDPAFETMEPVTAAKILPGGDSSGTNKHEETNMNYTKIIGVLVALGALSQAQADADDGPALEAWIKQMKGDAEALRAEAEALRAEAGKARVAHAERLVSAAVQTGRLPDQAESRAFWQAALSNPDEAARTAAEKALGAQRPARVVPTPTGATAEKVQAGVVEGAVTTEQAAQAARGEKLKAMALRNMTAHPGMQYQAAWALAEAELAAE